MVVPDLSLNPKYASQLRPNEAKFPVRPRQHRSELFVPEIVVVTFRLDPHVRSPDESKRNPGADSKKRAPDFAALHPGYTQLLRRPHRRQKPSCMGIGGVTLSFVNFKYELPLFIEWVLPLQRHAGFAKFLRPQRALLSTPAVALHSVNVLL
jgi:hypothetical protein